MFKRKIEKDIDKYITSDEVKSLFIWGPRRSGKTTILDQLAKRLGVKKYNFDLQSDREKFLPRKEVLDALTKQNKVILIDEVQNYPEATVVIKLLHDEYKTKVIATGSSELRQKSKNTDFDSLAGRYIEIYCLPLSIYEIFDNQQIQEDEKIPFMKQLSSEIMITGGYPEVYTRSELSQEGKIEILQGILDTYVLKDIIDIYDLKNEKLAKDILTKVALQLGSEVSVREIASSLGAYSSTVANYIEIFIKNYILIPLPSFKTNTRKAISEYRKLYFYDLGLRNILVQDFRELALRPDKGGVFENFIVTEIEKQKRNTGALKNLYFYREYGGKEVDLVIEDYYKNYQCIEIKLQGKEGNKDTFPLPNKFATINNDNYFKEIHNLFTK